MSMKVLVPQRPHKLFQCSNDALNCVFLRMTLVLKSMSSFGTSLEWQFFSAVTICCVLGLALSLILNLLLLVKSR